MNKKNLNKYLVVNKKIETINIFKTEDPLRNIINTPLIFKKKENKSLIKPLDYVLNDTGQTRHYPPAAQE